MMSDSTKSITRFDGFPKSEIGFLAREVEIFAKKNNIQPVKTGSDGKYKFKLNSSDVKLIGLPESIAHKEKYIWLVEAINIPGIFSLSNDNIYGSNCVECTPVNLDKSFIKILDDSRKIFYCHKELSGFSQYGCDSKKFIDEVKGLKTSTTG